MQGFREEKGGFSSREREGDPLEMAVFSLIEWPGMADR